MAGGLPTRAAIRALAVALAIPLAGCAGAKYGASFATNSGEAYAKPGVSAGRINTIRIADVGGPLTRAGLLGLSVGVAASAVKVDSQTTSSHRSGDYIVTTTTTTGHIDADQAAAAGNLMNVATGSDPIGLQASLEIASTKLGGDGSGWMYNLGYGSEALPCGPGILCRIYGGIEVGKFTFYDRTRISRSGLGTFVEQDIDSTFWAVGTPIKVDLSPAALPILSLFLQADVNWVTMMHQATFNTSSPSPWRAGLEAKIKLFFVRGELAWSRMDTDTQSAMVEAGVGF